MDEDETNDGQDPPAGEHGPPEDDRRGPFEGDSPPDDVDPAGDDVAADDVDATGDGEGLDGEDDDEGLAEIQAIPPDELKAHFELFYRELHTIASRLTRGLGVGHTLQPTALIHEAFLKLFAWSARRWRDTGHFLAVAARAMRHVLFDHERRKRTGKRQLLGERLPLDQLMGAIPIESFEEFESLYKALEVLHRVRPRAAEIIDMWYFLGLSQREAKELCKETLEISERTFERDYAYARKWLAARLG